MESALVISSIDGCIQPEQPQVDWPTKRNPRTVGTGNLLRRLGADPITRWLKPRPGKLGTVWEEGISVEAVKRPLRRIFRLIERDIDRRGQ